MIVVYALAMVVESCCCGGFDHGYSDGGVGKG